VLFGTDPGSLTSDVSLGGSRTDHELTLGGLEPNTRYYYAVGTLGEILAGGDADHFFVTPPGAGTPKPTRIWVLGDPGTGNTNAMNVRDAYYDFTDDLAHGGADARNTDLFLMLGDNADPQGTQQDYQENVFEIYARSLRQSVLWPAIGNHDLFHDDTQTWPYYDIFTLPSQGEAGGVVSGTEEYYSYDYGNIHFVVLNSVQTTMVGFGDDMLAWLTADLQDATEDWIIAYWHHPPFSKGSHDSDDPTDSHGRLIWMRENALPVLEDHGVDLVLSGHSHSYERSYLIDGHYGDSSTFVESMKKDPGDGDENGDGAYVKPYRGEVPYQGEGDGAVYAVAGCSSHLSPGKAEDLGGTEPNHPAMDGRFPRPVHDLQRSGDSSSAGRVRGRAARGPGAFLREFHRPHAQRPDRLELGPRRRRPDRQHGTRPDPRAHPTGSSGRQAGRGELGRLGRRAEVRLHLRHRGNAGRAHGTRFRREPGRVLLERGSQRDRLRRGPGRSRGSRRGGPFLGRPDLSRRRRR
jgi:hypothetical protein